VVEAVLFDKQVWNHNANPGPKSDVSACARDYIG